MDPTSVFRKAEFDLLAPEDNSHCPTQYSEMLRPTIGPVLAYTPPPPDRPDSLGCQKGLGGQVLSPPGGLTLEEPGLVSLQLSQLPARVSNTILDATAPSSRRLYTLKRSVFHNWCSEWSLDPVMRRANFFFFLQELLDIGCAPSTLKVYVAAITANHSLKAGQPIGRNDLIVNFLKGTRRLNPPHPQTVSSWYFSIVPSSLRGPLFELLWSAGLLPMSSVLLLALA